jgi:hypothetical protein
VQIVKNADLIELFLVIDWGDLRSFVSAERT